jgi:TonB-linked SusC/RagA family outer membrane protein
MRKKNKLFLMKRDTWQKLLCMLCILCCSSLVAHAQKKVTGTVFDVNSGPIIGVSVVENGTTNGNVTDVEGKFSLTVSNNAVLKISFIGYVTQNITVGNQTSLTVTLVEDNLALEEVIIVGYGAQKKVTLTGAVASVGSEDLVKTKSGDLQNSLAGRISGVKVNQRTSEPGTFTGDFNIRGMGTPLVVIDGVPRDNIMRLDENEIESISILKDASAAVYGSRAANGVVLITTKRGSKDKKFSLEYTGYMGVENMLYNTGLMDAVEYMQIQNEKAANNYTADLPFKAVDIDPYLNGTKVGTDFLGAIVKDSPMQQHHSFSASGGSEKIDYFVNFGYFEQEGWFKANSSGYNRYNLRSNVTAQITNRLKADFNINLISDERNQQPEGTWRVFNRGLFRAAPIYPLFVDNDPNYPFDIPGASNPAALTDPNIDGYNFNKERAVQTSMVLEYDIPGIDGLKAKGMYSYDYTEDEVKIFRKGYVLYKEDKTPSGGNSWNPIDRYWAGWVNTLMQLSLDYHKTFDTVHNVGATLIYEESDREGDNFYAERHTVIKSVDQLFAGTTNGQVTGQLLDQFTLGGNEGNSVRNALYHYANKGFIGRFTYDYVTKYLVDFSFRYDGSSRFAPGHQWGFFPVISGGWRLSEEAFVKDKWGDVLSNLKIRASYGLMGDETSSSYQFLTGYNYGGQGSYVFDNALVEKAISRGITNPDITWFTSKVIDLGVDVGIKNGLLGIVFDVYQRNQSGLLATRFEALPSVVGATLPQENLNSNQTRGIELSLTHRNRVGSLGYSLMGNISLDRTKDILHEDQSPALDAYDKWRNKTADRWQNIVWGYDQIGQYKSFEEIFNSGLIYDAQGNSRVLPGDFIYEDWNGDGVIDGNDNHPIGTNTNYSNGVKPLLNYGFGGAFDYKGFDLNFLLQGAALSWRTYGGEYQGVGANVYNGYNEFVDRWHRVDQMNPTKWQEWVPGKYPSVYWEVTGRGFITSTNSYWLRDLSYLRLKSLEIGYTLPGDLTRKIGVSRVRVFGNAYNALTWSLMPLGDPEVQDENVYPLNRTFALGLNVSF